ncbi:MAG TPA: 30S ribosomal protein S11 [Candidatus Acidoferrum sp.]|nr:30S ribosomal protein S11 [Candidatus Acidoferrum sp.]
MPKKPEAKKPEQGAQKKEATKKDISYEAKAMEEPKIKPKGDRLAVVHVFSSKNDTIITLTDMSGAETIAVGSGGMVVSADSQEGSPYAAMQAAYKVAAAAKERGITHINITIRAPGGHGAKTPGPGANAVVRVLARSGLIVNRIEDSTPIPTDTTKRPGGRRGRRV